MRRVPFLSISFLPILLAAVLTGGGCAQPDSEDAMRAVAPQASPAEPAAAPSQSARARGAIPPRPEPELKDEERATIELFEHAWPAAVFIASLAVRRNVFSLNVTEIPQGSGSGFIWDRQGHVVTNYHVIASANAAQVTLADPSNWHARLVGEAPAGKLTPLPIGSSENLRVGQSVFAIGNPFGLDQTLTTGVISALGREIQSLARVPIRDVIQTDAAINPGN